MPSSCGPLKHCLVHQLLQLIVQHKHEGSTSSTQHVREGSLEEGAASLLLEDGGPAVDGVLVDDLGGLATRLHHHATTHGVEGIGHDSGNGGHDLSDGPRDVDRGVLGVGQHVAGGIVETEVRGTVDDDALDGHSETAVQSTDSVGLEDLGQTVAQTAELALSSALADISSQTVY